MLSLSSMAWKARLVNSVPESHQSYKSRFHLHLAPESFGEEEAAEDVLHQQHVDRRALFGGLALEVDDVARPPLVQVLRHHLAREARRRGKQLPAALLPDELLYEGVGHLDVSFCEGRLEARRAGVAQLLVLGCNSGAERLCRFVLSSEHCGRCSSRVSFIFCVFKAAAMSSQRLTMVSSCGVPISSCTRIMASRTQAGGAQKAIGLQGKKKKKKK